MNNSQKRPREENERLRSSDDVQHDDFGCLLKALGLFDGARPQSRHWLMQNEILPAIEKLRKEVERLVRGQTLDGFSMSYGKLLLKCEKLRTRAKRTNYEVFGLRVDVAAWRETSNQHQKNAERAEEEVGKFRTQAEQIKKALRTVPVEHLHGDTVTICRDDCPGCAWQKETMAALQQQTTDEEG